MAQRTLYPSISGKIMEMLQIKDKLEELIRDNDPSVVAMVVLSALQQCVRDTKINTSHATASIIDRSIDFACEDFFG